MSTGTTGNDRHADPDSVASPGEAERFWEQHYRGREQLFSGDANPLLVQVAGPLAPGAALDLGCGEGGDTIWLATQGWQVTAVDVAATALARVAERAKRAGLADQVNLQRHDLAHTVPAGTFDLVSAQYLQSPVAFPRAQVLRAAARTVAVGGLLLVVDHASVPPWSWADPDTHFLTPQQTLDSLQLPAGQWHPEHLEAPSRQATGLDGQPAAVIDNVIAVRRIAP